MGKRFKSLLKSKKKQFVRDNRGKLIIMKKDNESERPKRVKVGG